MIGKEEIEKLKAQGAWIITSQTWRKWQESGKARIIGKTRQCLGYVPVFDVSGKLVTADWILTYGHGQYERLIPVEVSTVEREEAQQLPESIATDGSIAK